MVNSQTVRNFIYKLPVPFIYAASGWLITEIPVIIGIVPPTIDINQSVYSTATVVSGLSFIFSAALWLHAELGPYISKPSGSAPVTPTIKVMPPAPPQPSGFVIDSNSKAPKVGQSFTISVTHGTPNSKFTVYDAQNDSAITASYQLDANGNGSINYSPLDATTGIGWRMSIGETVELYAMDAAGQKTTNTITLG